MEILLVDRSEIIYLNCHLSYFRERIKSHFHLQTEEQIVELLQNGSKKALEIIFANYSRALLGVINTLVKDQELSNDILQESLVKIWQNGADYDASKGRLYTWMLNICRNQAIDTLRSRNYKMGSKIQSDENYVSERESNMHIRPDEIGVQSMPEMLPDDQKLLVELVYFKGYTQQEISDEFNIPLGTVKTRIRSALKRLKEQFNG